MLPISKRKKMFFWQKNAQAMANCNLFDVTHKRKPYLSVCYVLCNMLLKLNSRQTKLNTQL